MGTCAGIKAVDLDELTRVGATTEALQAVALGLMGEHLNHCVAEAMSEGGETAEAKVRDGSDAIARLVCS